MTELNDLEKVAAAAAATQRFVARILVRPPAEFTVVTTESDGKSATVRTKRVLDQEHTINKFYTALDDAGYIVVPREGYIQAVMGPEQLLVHVEPNVQGSYTDIIVTRADRPIRESLAHFKPFSVS